MTVTFEIFALAGTKGPACDNITNPMYSDGTHPEDSPDGIDHWPADPDGGGTSLSRKVLSDYGNDPDNWTASLPSPDE